LNITKAAATKAARATLTTLAVASICMLGSVAQASASGDSSAQETVRYGDLNLSDAKGVQVLYWRLLSASKTLCQMPDQRELARAAVAARCVERTMVQAITAVDNPQLRALYFAKTGTTELRFATVARIG
jgi:UrcA family protein